MCTAISYKSGSTYFGRNLDYEFSYGEEVVIIPRNYPIKYKYKEENSSHYAVVGMVHIENNFPLLYDGINEHGLGMAGLNFVGNCHYEEFKENKDNIASFEFILYILSTCKNVKEVKEKLRTINVTNDSFSPQLPPSQLHYIVSDADESIVIENRIGGIKVFEHTIGVLTNNPPFEYQMAALNNYRSLSNKDPINTFSKDIDLSLYSRGMGAIGLPGDLSSQSRFVRVAFTKFNSTTSNNNIENVNQFFHIMHSVEQQDGVCEVKEGKYEYTIYTSCCDLNKGIYYYTTYKNHQINAINMHDVDLNATGLFKFKLLEEESINYQSK